MTVHEEKPTDENLQAKSRVYIDKEQLNDIVESRRIEARKKIEQERRKYKKLMRQ